ncbi:MAG: class I SAM-dependent methyltransferase [Bacteroidetes bacterium]|nr:class I SAM-dependent methyltransferase [Bacteroidota bacterium]
MIKQVDYTHYNFEKYISKKRWSSIWYQVKEIISIKPNNVLEIGPGLGIFKMIMKKSNINVETIDIDKDLNPDYVGSVLNLPFNANSYSVVCAFQILEHLPYNESLLAFKEIVRVADKYVVISLPDSKKAISITVRIPKLSECNIIIPIPLTGKKKHIYAGEHYWELNKRGYNVKKVKNDYLQCHDCDLRLLKEYSVPEYPYHCFFVFEKISY